MDPDVPYLGSVSNVTKILDKMQKAGVPEIFNRDFLRDLGFTGSNDRPMVKVLKYLGMLDSSNRPQNSYREFMDHTRARKILASRLRAAYDDLFVSDRTANAQSAGNLKGWFKTKTGAGDAAAEKMASTFKALATYADFSDPDVSIAPSAGVEEPIRPAAQVGPEEERRVLEDRRAGEPRRSSDPSGSSSAIGFVYRIEIHLPDTQNVETFRAIFRALREEIM